MARKMRDARRERWWRDVLRQFARSGLGVRDFCGRENLAESAFYFWRREIIRRDAEISRPSGPARRARPRRAESRTMLPRGIEPRATSASPSFLPVRVSDAAAHEASFTLELAGGRLLHLPEAIPAQRLAEIVVALEATCVVARTGP